MKAIEHGWKPKGSAKSLSKSEAKEFTEGQDSEDYDKLPEDKDKKMDKKAYVAGYMAAYLNKEAGPAPLPPNTPLYMPSTAFDAQLGAGYGAPSMGVQVNPQQSSHAEWQKRLGNWLNTARYNHGILAGRTQGDIRRYGPETRMPGVPEDPRIIDFNKQYDANQAAQAASGARTDAIRTDLASKLRGGYTPPVRTPAMIEQSRGIEQSPAPTSLSRFPAATKMPDMAQPANAYVKGPAGTFMTPGAKPPVKGISEQQAKDAVTAMKGTDVAARNKQRTSGVGANYNTLRDYLMENRDARERMGYGMQGINTKELTPQERVMLSAVRQDKKGKSNTEKFNKQMQIAYGNPNYKVDYTNYKKSKRLADSLLKNPSRPDKTRNVA
jgi:hypothetical protein